MYLLNSVASSIGRRPRSFCQQACSLVVFIATIVDIMEIATAARMSGLYVDNGRDQTVVHRVVSQREKREVEHEILNLLGLPDRPRSVIGKVPQVKRSAPKFLIDIYKNALGEDKPDALPGHRRDKAGEFDLTGQDLRAIDQSDVIMTFAAHSKFTLIFMKLKNRLQSRTKH